MKLRSSTESMRLSHKCASSKSLVNEEFYQQAHYIPKPRSSSILLVAETSFDSRVYELSFSINCHEVPHHLSHLDLDTVTCPNSSEVLNCLYKILRLQFHAHVISLTSKLLPTTTTTASHRIKPTRKRHHVRRIAQELQSVQHSPHQHEPPQKLQPLQDGRLLKHHLPESRLARPETRLQQGHPRIHPLRENPRRTRPLLKNHS